MKKIWLVNNVTGVIQGSGYVSNDLNINSITAENSIAVELPPSNDLQLWQQDQWVDRPTRPDDNHLWVDGAWQLDELSLVTTIHRQRNMFLTKSDWTQIPNNPLTAEQQTAWATYRQALRDITTQSGYPFDVTWPTTPQ